MEFGVDAKGVGLLNTVSLVSVRSIGARVSDERRVVVSRSVDAGPDAEELAEITVSGACAIAGVGCAVSADAVRGAEGEAGVLLTVSGVSAVCDGVADDAGVDGDIVGVAADTAGIDVASTSRFCSTISAESDARGAAGVAALNPLRCAKRAK
ncbi:MAG TPA: hypothetical protein VJS66_00895 [Burkholderiales bacterium]|nr:hypothetical protein [Burkholderiales bacterium]